MGNFLPSNIATTMVEKQKEAQKEMQKDMSEIQLKNMLRGQERMRRMMIAQQMALTRERLWWLGGFGTFGTLGLIGYSLHSKNLPRPALVPLVGYWTGFAYQWDFAYGTKIDRVNRYTEEILSDDKYWFNPVLPDEVPELKKKDKQ